MRVLVLVEQRYSQLKKNALEALSVGRRLAGTSKELAALIIGSNVGEIASQISGYGADRIFIVDEAEYENYNAMNYCAAMEAAIKAFDPKIVLGIASPMGRDIFPRMAARFDGGIITDAICLAVDEGGLVATKPVYAGKCLAEVTIKDCDKQFVTLRPNVFVVNKSEDGAGNCEKLEPPQLTEPHSLTTTEIRRDNSGKIDLTEAKTVVAGGRSLKSAANFGALEELALVMNAAVGASRAAVDAGYRPHSDQVGQTGKTVSPNLYIACGISGAIQHLAGMRTAKIIVAINLDPDAPIFSIADYGIVGDLFEVVPVLTKKLKEII